jgi:hypothetical protein
MTRLVLGLTALAAAVAWLSAVAGPRSHATAGPTAALRTIELRPAHHKTTVVVRPGDTLDVRLPMLRPLTWALDKGQDAVKELPEKPAAAPAEAAPRPRPDQDPPKVGGQSEFVRRYTVTAAAGQEVSLEWLYCKFGKPEVTRERLRRGPDNGGVPQPPPYQPGLDGTQLREGMVYQVTLRVE